MAKGSLSCGQAFCKLFLIIVNVIFILGGIGLIAAGAVVKVALTYGNSSGNNTCQFNVNHPLDSLRTCFDYFCAFLSSASQGGETTCKALSDFPIGFIVIGAFIFLLAVFGCCGATKQNRCCLSIYFVLLLVIFLAQVAIAIVGFAFSGTLDTWIEQTWTKASTTQKGQFENTFMCCGWNTLNCSGPTQYSTTCKTRILGLISSNIAIAAGVAIGVVVVEILGMIGSCCVRKGAAQDKREEQQYAQAREANRTAYATAV